jgi:hypothetical protein
MHGLGKPFIGTSSAAKTALAITAVFLLASAATVLLSTQASAQINIDGLIRGALQQRGGTPFGYRAPSGHSSTSSHHESDSSDDDAANSKSGKGIKSTNDGADSGSGGNGGGGNSGASKGSGSGSQSASTGGPSGGSGGGGSGSGGGGGGGSAKTPDDMPSFTPSR